MAHQTALSNAGANAALNALTALLNSGFLDIYNGTQPATADTAVTTQTKLSTVTFGVTAFGAAVAGVATANAIGKDNSIAATGTATWARLTKSDHTTVVCDLSVSASVGSDIVVSSASFTLAGTFLLTSLTLTLPEGP